MYLSLNECKCMQMKPIDEIIILILNSLIYVRFAGNKNSLQFPMYRSRQINLLFLFRLHLNTSSNPHIMNKL